MLTAQEFYSKKPWIISYGINTIFEDRNQFERYLNNEPVIWNISPITFGFEKRIKNGIGILGLVGTNVYPEKQKISGITLKTSADIFFIEFGSKLNFVQFLKYKTNFDPYILTTAGYLNRSITNEINLNFGIGTNYWFNKKFGLNINGIYRINESITAEKVPGDLIQFSVMIIQIID